ncbi:MAG: poly(A) polymerase [Planctomycetota bacterium]
MSVLDVDAVRAVTRLIDKGFEAYLVGGCVRDLLLGRTPKDYDIATEARPPQVKRTFPRNCRIIGRRFKLAHLHFHGNTKILECSTFRRTPQENPEGAGDEADLLITRDNEFGTAEEDAVRRDFTVNALFLDPTRDLIVDHCKGLEDIEAKVIRTIGDPVVRFREDPVRILRAAKFAGRLGFTVEKHTLAAMGETAEDLKRAAPPRVLEEILRLLRSGHAKSSFELLRDVGAIEHLIPVVGKFLNKATDPQHDTFWSLLDTLDRRVQSQPEGSEPPPNGVLLAVMMYGAVEAEREHTPTRSASSIAEKLLGSLAIDLRLPRRDSGCLKRICGVQHRFDQPEDKRRFGVEAFLHSPYFEEALQLYALRTAAAGNERTNVDHWYDLAGTHPIEGDDQATGANDFTSGNFTSSSGTNSDDDGDAEEAPRKKRRRRRRRSDDEDGETNDASTAAPAVSEREPHEASEEVERDSHPAPNVDQDDSPAEEEAPVTKKKATRKKAAKKSVAKKRAAAKAPAEKDPIAEDQAGDDQATDDQAIGQVSTGQVSKERLAASEAPARKSRARKKPRTYEEEDLSDVTFPSDDEPAPDEPRPDEPRRKAEPIQQPSQDEQPKPEKARRRGAQSEHPTAAFPRDRGNETHPDDREPRDREPQEQPAADRDARSDEPRGPRAERPRRGRPPRRGSRDDDHRDDRRDDDHREQSRQDDDRDRDSSDRHDGNQDVRDREPSNGRSNDSDSSTRDDRDRNRGDRDDRDRDDRDRGESQGDATAKRSDRDGDDRNDSAPRKRRSRGRRGRSRADDDRGDDRAIESREEPRDDSRQGGEQRNQDLRSQDPRSQEQRSQNDNDGDEAARPRPARSRLKGNKPAEGRDRKPRDSKRDGKKDSKRPSRRDDKRDDKRDGRRDSKRDGPRGKRPSRPTGGRDVDVVPRYRDRRGPVEVIEPPTLDLSAFDVELDPKRVPTFGSIVEGKNRPKKRGPRIMDGDNDSYRPPPPPGTDGKRPDTPPPAPPAEGSDTFGDW